MLIMYDEDNIAIGVTSLKRLNIISEVISYTAETFFRKYRQLARGELYHVLLESGRGGRYSIAALKPETIFTGKNHTLTISHQGQTETFTGNPLKLVNEWMSHFQIEKIEGLPDFQGGLIGYISYDYARYIERLPQKATNDLNMPELYFLHFTEWFVFDHEKKELLLLALYEEGMFEQATKRLSDWQEQWTSPIVDVYATNEKPTLTNQGLEVSMDEAGFIEAVNKVKDYIAAGDVFQVNLSVRQAKSLTVSPMSVYEKLREFNPSPYMGLLYTPEFQLVSASPELLIKKKGNELSTRPIAGTRSRGQTDEEDVRLANELIENEKERAEHVMLVDLERNDLGRVCRYGSVEVNEFMEIEKYSHVMHIVSNVRGELADGKTIVDIIEAVFPGGTITGAPKVRTMEIIEELEPVQRGPYTGSLGWIGFNGDLELNIIIRTMLVKDGKAYVQAGAGVVIDSNPQNEYKESLKKAFALWRAKEQAEQARGESS